MVRIDLGLRLGCDVETWQAVVEATKESSVEITLADGSPFLFLFPVYVPMKHDGGNRFAPEPIRYAGPELHVPIYSDEDNARSGMSEQGFEDLVPLTVRDEAMLRQVVANFERAGATHLAIDICTIPNRPGGHRVPIAIAFG